MAGNAAGVAAGEVEKDGVKTGLQTREDEKLGKLHFIIGRNV